MSTTFARLALEFVTKDAARAERETIAVERAAARAEAEAEKLAKSSRRATDALGGMGGAARKATDGLKGNCYDNSAVESFFKSLKAELVWRRNWQTRREVEVALFEYINGFYNPRRKHSALGWKSPVAFEQRAA